MLFFLTRREVLIESPPSAEEIVTVTGVGRPASSTRTSVQLVLSNSKGGNAHHPWLITVRRKLNSSGVGIVVFMLPSGLLQAWDFDGHSTMPIDLGAHRGTGLYTLGRCRQRD